MQNISFSRINTSVKTNFNPSICEKVSAWKPEKRRRCKFYIFIGLAAAVCVLCGGLYFVLTYPYSQPSALSNGTYAEVSPNTTEEGERSTDTFTTVSPSKETRQEKLYQVPGWGDELKGLGQVSGVTVNQYGQPVILHRGDRVWDHRTFNSTTHRYTRINEGRIPVNTVLTLDPKTGAVISAWGSDMFYMPHSITIDSMNNTWITDVAMHQVLKFFNDAHSAPTLRLGRLFEPGSDASSLCQPTSVAVASNGDIFVADGYCNSRVLKFRGDGELVRIYPQDGEFLSLVVPHSLALMENLDLLCVADRENMRVVCFGAELDKMKPPHTSLKTYTIHQPDLGRVFAIAAKGNLVYAVNGPTMAHIPIQGFTLDPVAEEIIDHWAPTTKVFSSPHAIAISPFGDALYVTEIGPNKVWKFKFVTE